MKKYPVSSYFLSFLISIISLSSFAVPQNEIPACDSTASYSGCILVNENVNNGADGVVQIYYRWLQKPDPNKKTFLFLHGGPGDSSDSYLNYKDFWFKSSLSNKFNLLFFDQRGSGHSTPIMEANFSKRKMKNYVINNLVDDIEEIRQQLLPNQKIGLIGHSFGGHLLFSYALTYPENIFCLISLHGGASGLGFISQGYFQSKEWEMATLGIDSLKLEELHKKVEGGQACSVPDEKPLPPSSWKQLQMVAAVGSYTQRQMIKPLLLQSIQVNLEENKTCPYVGNDEAFNNPQQNNLGLNVYANTAIICSSFLTETQIYAVNDIYQESAIKKKKSQCRNFASYGEISENNFNLLEKLKQIQVPMLVVGSENDQLVNPIVQYQIRDHLTTLQTASSSFVILKKCGHNSFLECPDSLELAISSFLQAYQFIY